MSPTRKTNISLSLNNEQELILLCLFGARFLDDSLTIKELEKLYASMYFALERNYGRYAEIVTGKLGIMSKVFGDILHDYERNDFEKK
jgi:5-methylcytosine-specific restriction endonuclease McrBC GTP-binding regulatory subunit McrB